MGAVYGVSEMISALALTMNDRKTGALARILPGEAPVILQLFGHDPVTMARAAEILLTGSFTGCDYAAPPAGIDLNMGCPVPKIVKNGDGSALMRDAALAARITASVKEVCVRHGVPLSVKFRSGWDAGHINAPEFAVAMVENGADRITVHCRTREQMYAPSADYRIAADVHRRLTEAGLRSRVTLCGNGDVNTPDDARRLMETGCDEVSIGRGVLGNPWLFRELSDPASFVPPTPGEIIDTAAGFFDEFIRFFGEEVGVREARGRAAHFIKGMRGAASVRDRLNHAVTREEFIGILRELGGGDD